MGDSHVITVICDGRQVGGWSGYHIDSSMITFADAFELRRPFDADAYRLLRRDADVTIKIDGNTVLRGFVERRERHCRAGTMVIGGRDRAGRLNDESAPRIDYSGMHILDAVEELADPWFETVTLTDAKNRTLRRGKGKRVASAREPVVPINIRTPRRGVVHPGVSRAQVIREIASRAGLISWSSASGRELFIGKPNSRQEPQYLFVHDPAGNRSTVRDMTIIEDDGDRYSEIMVAGTGGQGDTNYGKNVTDARGVVFDNPFNRFDGTGRDFIHAKRLFMPERDFESYGDAQQVAINEQIRRDYNRHVVSVEMDLHGQFLDGLTATLFTFNTVAKVIDREQKPELNDTYLIVSCSYSSEHDQGETTVMHMVPTGTEILL